MHRIPKPSEQARHLRGMLAEFGVTLTHQQTLEMVARLHGHKSWNVMQASPAVVRDSKDDPKLKALEAAARAVLDSESNRGRYEDLTVVSRPAIAALQQARHCCPSPRPGRPGCHVHSQQASQEKDFHGVQRRRRAVGPP